MQRVLLVEDSRASQKLVESSLNSSALKLTVVETLAEAQAALLAETFDLILLDLSLPDGEGLTLLREVQRGAVAERTPVLLLTGSEDLDAKVEAFRLGAEDYLIKPVNPIELKARVEMRLRKARETKPPAEAVSFGPLKLNFTRMQATLTEDEREVLIDFTTKEFKIVATLIRFENQIFTRAQLVEAVWGAHTHVVDRTIDSHICGARRKMGAAGRFIQSVTGEGYRFAAPARVNSP